MRVPGLVWTRGGQTEDRPHPEDVPEEGLLQVEGDLHQEEEVLASGPKSQCLTIESAPEQ